MLHAAWHTLPAHEVVERLGTAVGRGLDVAEVGRRRSAHGANELTEGRRRGPLRMVLDQFTDFMVLVLIGAAILAGLLGEPEDSVAIGVIVVLNAVLGFVQEYRAERAMHALKGLAAPSARVRRDGDVATVPARDLVPGDLVLLEAGNMVPADVRLVECAGLEVDEAALTGESVAVEKTTAACEGDDLPLGDRRGMAYRGTLAVHGRGAGVVTEIGMQTELGRIATMLDVERTKTPLQRRLARFGRRLALAVIALCVVLFAVGLLRGGNPLLMFLTALSLAVAAIPEALPAVVTVALALGARRMVAAHALVRRLPAVETLGSVTYACSDKTGTLTQNRMRVVEQRPACPEAASALTRALALDNDAARGADGALTGDPTEVALYEAAEAGGVSPEAANRAFPRVAEVPFDSVRARMSTVHACEGGFVVYTKGAPERVLPVCTSRFTAEAPFDRAAALAEAETLAREGLRVLAVATRTLSSLPPSPESIESELVFLGLVGLMDPPRPEARDAVRRCQAAGIRVVMITGDHPETAAAVARSLGILGEGGHVLTGRALDALTDEQLAARVEEVRVYARVAPEQKIRIVAALQAHGELVAMTGDGVNDAPALNRADIGVAMGRGGTDVAREAAHMVLLDDNFASIVGAVRGLWQHTVWVGLLIGGVTLAVQAWAFTTGHAHWQSMTFTTLTLAQMAHVLAIRSERDSLFRQGLTSNLPLLGAVTLTFVLQMATLYVPPLQRVFHTQALSLLELAACLGASFLVFVAVEIEKALTRAGLVNREEPRAV
jgi:Ca2+-transporting ATPase